MAKEGTLSDKQERFCLEYIKDLNATQATIRAGYSTNGADVQGTRLLANASVAQRVAQLMKERSERVLIDADWVLRHNAAIVQADITDILEPDGRFKSPHDWPQIWRQIVSSFDIKRLIDAKDAGNEDKAEVLEQEMKVRFVDKLKALELLGKHNDIAAYAERHKHEHSHDLEAVLNRRLERAREPGEKVH